MAEVPLTDAELIELVGSKSPSELTEEEVECLRTRLRESEELRAELIDHLHMEAYLHAALGDYRVSVDELAAKVEAVKRDRRRRTVFGTGMGLLLVLVLAAGAWYVATRPDVGPPVVADGGDADPDDPDADAPGGGPNLPADDPARPDDPVDPVDVARGDPWAETIEAEAYVHSNLDIDEQAFGKGIGVLVDGREKPGFAEFVVDVPRAGLHQLELRHASDQARPLALIVNGEPVREGVASADTGAWGPEHQRAFVAARLELPDGPNRIRLEGPTFPHLDKLAVVEIRDGEGPVTDGAERLPTRVLRDFRAVDPGGTEGDAGPWTAWLAEDAEVLPFEEVCFDTVRPVPFDTFTKADLESWFEKGPKGWKTREDHADGRAWASIDGTARLRAPWPADAVLRLAIHDVHEFELHLRGEEDRGLVLRADTHKRPGLWGAYAVRFDGHEPRDHVLLSTDSGRHLRSEFGVIELRWQAGTLVMTRGPVRLLTVPLDAPPTAVLIRGRVGIRGIAMYRSTPVPAEPPTHRRLVVDADRPAEHDWGAPVRDPDGRLYLSTIREAEEPTWIVPGFPPGLDEATRNQTDATLTGHADGVVELAVARSTRTIDAAARIVEPGLHEFTFRVEEAVPGTGVTLGDDAGRPLVRLGFFHDQNGKRTAFRLFGDTDQTVTAHVNVYHQPWPYVGDEQWYRIVYGLDVIRLFASADGIHWGMVEHRRPSRTGMPTTIGLFCHRTTEPRSIRLADVAVREMSAVLDLADADVRDRVPVDDLVRDGTTYTSWTLRAEESRPDDVAADEWRRACAVRTLAHGVWPELIRPLTAGLVRESLERLPLDDALQLLEEVVLITDTSPHDRATLVSGLFGSLGLRAHRAGVAGAYESTIAAWNRAPFWTDAHLRPWLPKLEREVVVSAAASRDWRTVARVCGLRRFVQSPCHHWHLRERWDREKRTPYPWAEIIARRRIDVLADRDLPRFDRSWRHPLVSQLTKEAFNVMGEFEAALDAGAFDDACAIVAATDEQGAIGLLPDANDRRLLVSLPRAVATAMNEYPAMRTTMRDKLGPVARIRVREAMATGDVETVRSATVRYLGTEAAATAHAWLGDRDMAAGRVAQAAEHFRIAARTSGPAEQAGIETRLRLADAMLGIPPEGEIGDVVLGDQPVAADDFRRLLADVAPDGDAVSAVIASPDSRAAMLAPAAYRAESRGAFNGEAGQNLGRGRSGYTSVDWAGRQLGVAVDGDLMIVSNRFQIIAYRTGDGSRAWATGLGGDQGHAHEWALTPFRPIVAGRRVFARRLTKNGAELACLERDSGRVVWRTAAKPEFAADPVVLDGKLLAVVVHDTGDGHVGIDLVSLHPETGETLVRAPLVQQVDVWNGMPPCQLTAAAGRVLCSVGASLVCADGMGNVQWLRRESWLPVQLDERWPYFEQTPPRVVGDVILSVQPQTYEVVARDLGSGRSTWTASVPGLRSLAGVDATNGLAVVRTDGGFEARALADGELEWRFAVDDVFEVIGVAEGRLSFVRSLPTKSNRGAFRLPDLVWVDTRTGRETGHHPLVELEQRERQLGPVVPVNDGAWVFVGNNRREASRELFQLVRTNEPLRDGVGEIDPWEVGATPGVRTWLESMAPGWAMISPVSYAGGSAGHRNEFKGERNVFVTQVESNRPALFRSALEPTDEGHTLVVRVGSDSGAGWALRVLVDGREVHRDTIANDWRDVRIDLAAHVGDSVEVTVVHEANESGSGQHAYWKRIAVE